MKYWAFLSYSHTDTKWGDWLHKALETYRVPRRMIGKESRDGKIPERVFPIFRDREELPVSADLSTNINDALERSRYLIVVCSPRSAQSRWVGEEIKTFKKLGREDRILALIIDGEPNASDGKPGFNIKDECFHELMRHRLAADGTVTPQRTEPIAADAREGKDGKTNAKLKLLAGLIGVNYDELKQREQDRRLRRARVFGVAAVLLVVLFAALAGAVFLQSRKVRSAFAQADYLRGAALLEQGHAAQSLAYFARAVRSDAHRAAAIRITMLLSQRNWVIPAGPTLQHDWPIDSARLSSDGSIVVTGSDSDEGLTGRRCVRIWKVGRMKPEFHDIAAAMSPIIIGKTNLVLTPYHPFVPLDTKSPREQIRLWDASGNRVSAPWERDGDIEEVWLSGDGAVLAAVTLSPRSEGHQLRAWRTSDFTSFGTGITYLEANIEDISSNGEQVIVTSAKNPGVFRVWSVVTGLPMTKEIGYPSGHIENPRFSPDRRVILFATWLDTKYWEIWNRSTNRITRLTDAPALGHMNFSPDGRRIISADNDGWRQWSTDTGEAITKTVKAPWWPVAQFSPNGSIVLSGTMFFDAITTKSLAEPLQDEGRHFNSAVFNTSGARIVTSSSDGTARIWRTPQKKEREIVRRIRSIPGPQEDGVFPRLTTEFDPSYSLALSPLDDQTVEIFDVKNRQPLGLRLQQNKKVKLAHFNPGAHNIITSDGEETLVWDVKTGVKLAAIHHEPIIDAQCDDRCTKLFCISRHPEFRFRALEIPTGRVLEERSDVKGIRFTEDGRFVIVASSNGLDILDAESAQMLRHVAGDFYPPVAVSLDDRWLLASEGESAALIEFGSGRIVARVRHDEHIISAQFSRSGKMMVTGSGYTEGEGEGGESGSGGSARIWSVPAGQMIGQPIRGSMEVVEFSYDEHRVTTVGSSTRVWDVATGKPISEPMAQVNSVEFSPDGRWVVTGSGSTISDYDDGGDARIWDAATGVPLTDPIKSDKSVTSVHFTPDGSSIVGYSSNEKLAFSFPGRSEAPKWIADWAEAVGGWRLNDFGRLEELPDQFEEVEKVRHTILNSPSDEWCDFGKGFFESPPNSN